MHVQPTRRAKLLAPQTALLELGYQAICLRPAPPTKPYSTAAIAHYTVKLACLGGYLARAHDPPPGNTVIWRGLSRLTDIELGIMIGAQLVGN